LIIENCLLFLVDFNSRGSGILWGTVFGGFGKMVCLLLFGNAVGTFELYLLFICLVCLELMVFLFI